MRFSSSNPRERLNTARIMQRNVINTTYSSRIAQNPTDRPKVNDSDIEYSQDLKVHHLKEYLRDYGRTAQDQANNMKVIGKLIKQDKFYEESEQKKTQKYIIQNMFDGTRYSAALLKNLTGIKMEVVDSDARLF
ncbi:Oidioi.mRNA.OKI2018_I69.chr1.g960.t1.cds [Oikopleura dioica]|uniref:Oidioi.mRNA.OKI2018_I69.chr1.g960.t1.cds n=1 Tax=Oikopleura dioica TaxID=34765 RepID=A0ABN7SRH4_OIKDI|nr:Oidioi.mRNA.OKI2018_I69.chr1.g960.t1.cds [Oikopleura dioica]